MKKYILLLVIPLMLFSCSANRCVEVFMKEEMIKNREKKITSVLFDRKSNTLNILEIYSGLKIGERMSSQAKSFTKKDYDQLFEQYKNDTVVEFWGKNEAEKFNFERLIKMDESSKNTELSNSSNTGFETYLYNLSKPIFINKKEHALFSLSISKGRQNVIEDCVIIMKKEKGKWVLLEKVYNTDL